MLKQIKHTVSMVSLMVIAFALIFSKILSSAVFEGIRICTNILIPSMFIFLIISEFFYKANALNFILKPFNFLCEKLFKIDKNLGPIMFFSLICGYPSGANLIKNLVEKKTISKKTANRMLFFCVNSGPAFLIGGVSIPFLGSIKFGLILFASQIVAFFVVGTLSSIGKNLEKININSKTKNSAAQNFVSSVKNSTKNMATICGFTIFFTALIKTIFSLKWFNENLNSYLTSLFSGLIEVTNGVVKCFLIKDFKIFLILALITSFGGICVHCQIIAIISKAKIPFKNFYKWRIIYCLTSVLVSAFLLKNFAIPTLAVQQNLPQNSVKIHNPLISISLVVLSIALLCCEKKMVIIKKGFKNKI